MKHRPPERQDCAFRGCLERGRIMRCETISGYPIRYCQAHEQLACEVFGSHAGSRTLGTVRQQRAAA